MQGMSATPTDAALNVTTGRGRRAQPFEPAAVRYIKRHNQNGDNMSHQLTPRLARRSWHFGSLQAQLI